MTELLVEVNLGNQFDRLLEMVIFLVAVDKVQYKDAHGRRNDQCMKGKRNICFSNRELFPLADTVQGMLLHLIIQ
jgi:hypothetical protein